MNIIFPETQIVNHPARGKVRFLRTVFLKTLLEIPTKLNEKDGGPLIFVINKIIKPINQRMVDKGYHLVQWIGTPHHSFVHETFFEELP